MPKTVEFFYDFTSPTAYLAWSRLPAIAQRTGATIIYRPDADHGQPSARHTAAEGEVDGG